MASWWQSYIARRARALGLDPRAVLAVASQEGLSGAVGDQGTSYGPFQLHRGGALPAGRGRSWAESQQGIDYALSQIAGVARGQRGGQAISSIVSRFERPADPRSEIAGALRSYGGGSSGAPLALPTASPTGQATPGPDSTSLRANVLSSLIAASQETGQHRTPDYTPVFAGLAALRQGGTAGGLPSLASSSAPLSPVGGARGRVLTNAGADRPGVSTKPVVRQFVSEIAGIVGHPLTIGTGTNHSRMTADGNVSDHWSGHAADIPATGRTLIQLGQAALIAAGMPPVQARRQRGGLFNVGGHQIIFNTHQGGDHTNHLHVSA